MHQAGLIDYALRKARQIKNPCSINKKIQNKYGQKQSNDDEKLQLNEFGVAFFILGMGFGFATLVLAAEFIFKQIIRIFIYTI